MSLKSALAISMCLVMSLFFGVYKFDKMHKSHRAVDKVFLYLQWFDQAQFAGFYVALDKGFYDDADLEVQIVPRPRDPKHFFGDPASNKGMPKITLRDWNVPEIISASDDVTKPAAFGVWTGDQVLEQFQNNNLRITAIGTVFDRSLACFMVLAGSQIYSPKDFAGKTVGVYRGYDTEIIYDWLVSTYHPEPLPTKVALEPTDDVLDQLRTKKIDVLSAYAINEPILAQLSSPRIRFRLIYPDFDMLGYYSDTIIANREMLSKHPDVGARFLEATERGWRYALDHQSDAVETVVRYDQAQLGSKRGEQARMLQKIASYVRPNNPMLAMDEDSWKSMSQILKQEGAIANDNGCLDLCDFSIAGRAHDSLHHLGDR